MCTLPRYADQGPFIQLCPYSPNETSDHISILENCDLPKLQKKRQKSPSPTRSEERQAPSEPASHPVPEKVHEVQRDNVEAPKGTGETLVEEREEVSAEEHIEEKEKVAAALDVLEVAAAPAAADPSFTSVFDIEPPFKESDSSFLSPPIFPLRELPDMMTPNFSIYVHFSMTPSPPLMRTSYLEAP